jgi:hypothetical protein
MCVKYKQILPLMFFFPFGLLNLLLQVCASAIIYVYEHVLLSNIYSDDLPYA